MIPSVIYLGPIPVHLYGLLIGLGILTAGSLSAHIVKKLNPKHYALSSNHIWDSLFYAVIGGIIGARLYHVIDLWDYYRHNLVLIPQVWSGGLGIYGAFAGGVLALYYYAKKHHLKLPVLLDVSVFGIPVAQAIGRIGNFINQELYGLPTNLPWGLPIDLSHRLPGYETFTHFHPLFAYEAILNLISAGIIWGFHRKGRWQIGQSKYFALYLLNYSIIRTLLEGLRINPWSLFGLPTAQIIGIVIIIISGHFLIKKS